MTRKNRSKISISKTKETAQSVQTIGIKSEDDLPPYVPYVDGLNKKGDPYRFFLEHPAHPDLADISILPGYNFVCAGKYSRGGGKLFSYLFTDGSKLLCEHLAKSFACLLIKKAQNTRQTGKSIRRCSNKLLDFLKYLSTLPEEEQPKTLSTITPFHFSNWLSNKSFEEVDDIKNSINSTLKLSKHYGYWKFNLINTNNSKSIKNTEGDAPLKVDAIDDLMKGEDYSDPELMQILAYCFYQIQSSMEAYEKTMGMTQKKLGETYIPLDSINTKNKTLIGYMIDENEGHEIIRNNLYFHWRNNIIGKESFSKSIKDSCSFINKITDISLTQSFKLQMPNIKNIKRFIFKDMLDQSYPTVEKYSPKKKAWTTSITYRERLESSYHTGHSVHPEWAVATYAMISTGVNKEVLRSWKWSIDGKPWYENFDIQLGLDKDATKKDAQIVLVGQKRKGQSYKTKNINVPIKVNSPLYNYLKYLDQIREKPREFIFNIPEYSVNSRAFCRHYEMYDDQNERLTSIQSPKLRKVFAGHKLIQMLDNVKSGDELVLKLRKALNHSNFDTTFFSYLLKSGAANLVLNTAIVALTSELLDKALTFKGTIKTNSDEKVVSNEVFLCNCTDPSKPTHGLPIAGRCRKYDMCLGCERSEVYPEHLSNIFYRIFQYEEQRSKNINEFRAMSEDRLIIATKTIDRFREEHHQGEVLINEAYCTASHAYNNGIKLIPPILQF